MLELKEMSLLLSIFPTHKYYHITVLKCGLETPVASSMTQVMKWRSIVEWDDISTHELISVYEEVYIHVKKGDLRGKD